MALRFIDSFDHYSYSDTAKKKWDDGSLYTDFIGGRFGTQYRVRPGGSGAFNTAWTGMTKTINPAGVSKIIAGFAVKFDQGADAIAGSHPFLAIRGDDGKHQIQLFLDPATATIKAAKAHPSWPTGSSQASVSSFTPTYFADTGFMPPFGLWFYFEIKVDTGGTIELYADSELILSDTGSTLQSGASGYTGVRWMAITPSNAGFDMDDVYIADGEPGLVTDVLGEVRVENKQPTANGAINNFTPSVGTNNAAMVDGVTGWIDTYPTAEYNASDVLDAIDLYQMADYTRDGNIFGVQVNLAIKKDDVGLRKVKPILRSGSTNYLGTEQKAYSDYIYVGSLWEENPATTSPWTLTEVNATQAGVKITV